MSQQSSRSSSRPLPSPPRPTSSEEFPTRPRHGRVVEDPFFDYRDDETNTFLHVLLDPELLRAFTTSSIYDNGDRIAVSALSDFYSFRHILKSLRNTIDDISRSVERNSTTYATYLLQNGDIRNSIRYAFPTFPFRNDH